MRVIWRAVVMVLALGATAPAWAGGMYVRDELRINMRAGPGLEYRIVKLLKSGTTSIRPRPRRTGRS
jgi:uncharacterized protein YgiM (DUF1202 family)